MPQITYVEKSVEIEGRTITVQRNASNGWQKVKTPGGTESSPDAVERILRIEADDKDPSLTRFGCVLQGTVPPGMLKALRPDIGTKSPGAK